MKRKAGSIVLFSMVMSLLTGCVSSTGQIPTSFTRTQAQSWSTVEVRNGVPYDRAWDMVFDILVRNFEIDAAMREDGYIRTGWMHAWSGVYQANYRVRVTVKFSPDRSKFQFLSEAQVLAGQNWIVGTDSRLVSTLKTDLMGTIGRTTR